LTGRLALFAGLLLAAAAPAPPVGMYELSGVREAAGGLELRADGSFRYALTYGALDERAEGRWRQEGTRVLLTTMPAPRPPVFSKGGAEPGDPATFELLLETAEGQPIENFEVLVTLADGSEHRAQTRRDWLQAPLDAAHQPIAVRFRIPVFGVESEKLPLEIGRFHRYRFRFDPADLGVRDFRDWPLDVKGDLLQPEGASGNEGFRRVDP
jgi:hypothetical protein